MHPGKALIIPLLCAVRFNPGEEGLQRFSFPFSFKPRGTFLRLGAENTTCLFRFCFMCVRACTHTPFFSAVFAHHLACQVSFPLKAQPGFPSHLALNKRKGSVDPPLQSRFLPSIHPSILSLNRFLWSFPPCKPLSLRTGNSTKTKAESLAFHVHAPSGLPSPLPAPSSRIPQLRAPDPPPPKPTPFPAPAFLSCLST